jgi:hypothetical protein
MPPEAWSWQREPRLLAVSTERFRRQRRRGGGGGDISRVLGVGVVPVRRGVVWP